MTDDSAVQIHDFHTTERAGWAALVLIAALLLTYANSFNGAFVFDDLVALDDSPNIRHLWPIWRAMWANPNSAAGGRPLVSLSLAINYAISADRTWSYHVLNFATHAAAALALMGTLRRTFIVPRLAGQFGRSADLLSFAIALLWSLHPFQTESVTYISTRTESMAGLFYLLTVYSAIRANGRARKSTWIFLSLAACLAGALSKENIASAPLFVMLYDRILLFDSWRQMWRERRALYFGLAASWLALAALLATGSSLRLHSFGTSDVTAARYAFTQFGVIMHYLKLSFWPHPMIVDYFAWPLTRSLVQAWPYALTIVSLITLTILALVRRRPVGLLGAWFFLILAPSSSVIPLSTELVAERRMYLPLAAVVTLVVCAAYRAALRLGEDIARRLVVAFTVTASLILGSLTIRQNRIYASEIAFWQDQLAKQPDNPRAHNALGRSYQRVGRLEPALECYNRCLTIKPDFALAWFNRGTLLRALDRNAEALACLERAASIQPVRPRFFFALGSARLEVGDAAGAEASFRAAHRVAPDFPHVNFQLGVLAAQDGRLSEAADFFSAERRQQPDDARNLSNLGSVLSALGRTAEARRVLEESITHMPDNWNARFQLGRLLSQTDGPAAGLPLLEAASRGDPENLVFLDGLARALAAAGQFDHAAEVAQRAVVIIDAAGDRPLIQEWQQRVVRYRQHRE